MISLWDHLIVVGFTFLLPLYAAYRYPRFQRALAAGVAEARSRQYRNTTLRQWALTLAALGIWFGQGRSAEELGLGTPDGPGFWLALVVGGLLAIAWRQLFQAAVDDEEGRAQLLEQLRAVEPLLPANREELSRFMTLSATAGFCEELLFRGYLIWYASSYVGLPAAGVLSGVLFGLGHLYQGPRQAVKIVFLGLLFAAFYLGSGSLWIPMALHALLDAAQGRAALRLLASERARRHDVVAPSGPEAPFFTKK